MAFPPNVPVRGCGYQVELSQAHWGDVGSPTSSVCPAECVIKCRAVKAAGAMESIRVNSRMSALPGHEVRIGAVEAGRVLCGGKCPDSRSFKGQ